uniref:Uncharacterized protein n=1 Tax=Lotus japonicus TaxID=34305 RepID=I3SJT3_LOTJA|nr:unknown [Lotus japonicus]
MMYSSYGCDFINEILPISLRFAQHLYGYKRSTTKLSFVNSAIASFTQLILKTSSHIFNLFI